MVMLVIVINKSMIELSPKQEKSIINMENFLKIKSHRLSFQNKSELDDYFQLLLSRCKKKWKLLDNVEKWNITFSEINEKSKAKKTTYYDNEDVLRKYAIKYIEKYFPTIKKLEMKLLEKCQNSEMVDIVVERVKNLIDENRMIDNKIYLETMFWGQNINKIKTKLYNKRFPKELIEEKIEELKLNPDSLIDEWVMRNKIKRLIWKWKSKQEIMFKLKERPQDEEMILNILDKEYWEKEIESVLNKEYNKLKNKYEKQKTIQKLIAKWFKYKDIINVINNELC